MSETMPEHHAYFPAFVAFACFNGKVVLEKNDGNEEVAQKRLIILKTFGGIAITIASYF